jgi:glycosyltransferase involved in cell wall biosynthesis
MSVSSPAFVSVVSPIYNTEPYLEECVRSVLAQAHEHFEYILVDNQSQDRSHEIAADYAAKDRRIKLVRTPKFFSQLDNFNFSLSLISTTSRYTKMVLSDDWIFPSCLAEMVALADANPRVGIVGSYRLIGNQGGGFGLPVDRTVLSGRDACRMHLLDGVFLFGSPTNVLYRSDLVRQRPSFFRAGRIHFDTDLAFELLQEHDFGFVHQVLSFCRQRAESITASAQDYYPNALDRMALVLNHGRSFLNAEELQHCRDGAERFFYDGLARGWLAHPTAYPSSDFWQFQKQGLATAGAEIRPARLARAVARVALKTLANPLDVAKALRDGRR